MVGRGQRIRNPLIRMVRIDRLVNSEKSEQPVLQKFWGAVTAVAEALVERRTDQ